MKILDHILDLKKSLELWQMKKIALYSGDIELIIKPAEATREYDKTISLIKHIHGYQGSWQGFDKHDFDVHRTIFL